MGIEHETISKILSIPIDKIGQFKVRTIIGPGGKPVYLKSTLVKAEVDEETVLKIDQSRLSGEPVERLVEQLISLLETDAIPIEDRVRDLLVKLYALLDEKLNFSNG